MSTKHQHFIYTAEDINRYLAGQMSNDEMHAMEKAALDDPLLADAIEGYAAAEEQDWSGILSELKNKVETKEDTPVIDIKQTSFKWWKAAAAVLLIGVTATLAYVMNGRSKETEAVAKNEATPVLDSSVIANIKADSVDEKTVVINDRPTAETDYLSNKTPAGRSNGLVSEQASRNKTSDDFVYKPDFNTSDVKKERAVTYYDKQAGVDDKEITAQNVAPAAPSTSNNLNAEVGYNATEQNKGASAEPSILAYKKQADASNNLIKQQYQLKGKVVNQNGDPVSFAGLRINTPTNQFVTTDSKGIFNITAADSILNVEVTSAGYTAGRYKINANSDNGITLQPSNGALNEVTISSNIPKDKLSKKRVNSVDEELEETAEPTGGWDSYNEYLDNNVHLPGNNQNIRGTVEAIVKVNRKGEVADVKITRSLNDACDKEAVRVIKSGPGWKLKSGKKGFSKVKVRFQQ